VRALNALSRCCVLSGLCPFRTCGSVTR
jgi:hypothetical protein